MEWRTIPGVDAYEINERGTVRRRDSRYVMPVRGRQVRLWTGTGYVTLRPLDLVAEVFAVPSVTVEAASGPAPLPADPDELACLRAMVAELEAELTVYRVEL